jgi:hypothetical protein
MVESKLFPEIQTFFQEAGEAACYALCIVKIAEKITGKAIEPLYALLSGIERKFIYYNWDNPDDPDNFYVKDPEKFLCLFIGKRVTVIKVEYDLRYPAASNEYIVERWERPTAKMVYSHFRLPDWDSLHDSQTVKYGKLVSLRVFRLAA